MVGMHAFGCGLIKTLPFRGKNCKFLFDVPAEFLKKESVISDRRLVNMGQIRESEASKKVVRK